MSHFTRIKTQIAVLEYLKQALSDLNYTYQEGALTVRGYGGKQMAVDLAIQTKGYPIGFKRSGATYEVVADWWGVRGVKQKEFLQAVTQRYAYQATLNELRTQGFDLVSEQTEAQGQVHLVMRRMA